MMRPMGEKKTGTIFYTVRIPRDLKDLIKADAERNSRSINQHFVTIMREYLEGDLVPAKRLLTEPSVRRLIQAAVELNDRRRRKEKA